MPRIPFFIIIGIAALGLVAWSSEEMVPDFALEKRLEVSQWYTSEEGDTLQGISRLVYGHSTWWKKLKILNPKLRTLSPVEKVTPGTRIMYRSPRVGNHYFVRKNETLSRIAQWKYGTANAWRGLYERNRKISDDPNLIHPGDELIFEASGIVRNVTRGNQVVARVQTKHTPRERPVERRAQPSSEKRPEKRSDPDPYPEPVAPKVNHVEVPPQPSEVREPAVSTPAQQQRSQPEWIYWGVLALLFVVVTLFTYLSKRRAIASGDVDGLEDTEEPTQPMGIRAFRRKIEDGMQIDRSLLRDDYKADLEENIRPSYHTIVKMWFIKWLKLFGKN